MPNGVRGDHPVTDICVHGLSVFSPTADSLVRDIRGLASIEEMFALVDWFHPSPMPELERELTEILDRLRARAEATTGVESADET